MEKIIFDAHQDVLSYVKYSKETKRQTGFAEIVSSPIRLVTASIFLDPGLTVNFSLQQKVQEVERQIRKYLEIIDANPQLILVEKIADIEKTIQENLTGFLLGFEGMDFLVSENFEQLEYFYRLGVRSGGLVWGNPNALATDCKNDGGLSVFGMQVIQKMNQLGMIVDLAHSNEKTFEEVLKISRKPVMMSHGNANALCADRRNLTDEQIIALTAKGGVQGIFFSKKFVSQKTAADLRDAVRQIAYVQKLAPEAVMLGTDFGGISSGLLPGLESINDLEKLMNEIERQLGRVVMEEIAFKNYFNFLRKVL